MKHMAHGVAAAAPISLSSSVGSAGPARANQVDHAIILDLAAASAAAQAEVRLVLDAYREVFQ